MSKLTLDKAKEILNKYTTEHHLLIHAAAVSAAMGAMANYFHADKDQCSLEECGVSDSYRTLLLLKN